MKKIFLGLFMLFSFFSFTNVSAEEITTKTLSPEVETKVFDYLNSYEFSSEYDFPNDFMIYMTDTFIFALVYEPDDDAFIYYESDTNYLIFIHSNSSSYNISRRFIRFDLEGNNDLNNSSNIQHGATNITFISNLVYTTYDIYTDKNKTDIYLKKNYPKKEEVEPTPTTSPEPTTSPIPTDTPEIDTSELEKCDSFVCDITDIILDGVDNDRFPFIKTIFHYLLILVFVFTIISPFLVIKWFLGRWF